MNWATRVEVRWTSSNREDSDVAFVVDGKPEIQTEWVADDTLKISCPDCSEEKVFKRVTKLNKVKVVFDQ